MAKQKNTITEYRSYYLPLHFPVLLLSGDYWKISDLPSGRLHFHNCLEIGLCHSNSGIMEFYGEPIPFKSGDITIIPRNVPHTTYSTKGTESKWSYLFFDPYELLKTMLPSTWKNFDLSLTTFTNNIHILAKDTYPYVHQLFQQIILELEEQRPNYQIASKGLLLTFFIELFRIERFENNKETITDDLSNKTPDNALVIGPALDYIEDNYMNQFSIEFLATLCHWSPTHFRRVFHDIMGTSPLDFINNTRIMRAANFLRSTEESILDISEQVGFHSVSSFNRYFIKIMKISPREYRKQMKQSNKRDENPSILEYAGWLMPEK